MAVVCVRGWKEALVHIIDSVCHDRKTNLVCFIQQGEGLVVQSISTNMALWTVLMVSLKTFIVMAKKITCRNQNGVNEENTTSISF